MNLFSQPVAAGSPCNSYGFVMSAGIRGGRCRPNKAPTSLRLGWRPSCLPSRHPAFTLKCAGRASPRNWLGGHADWNVAPNGCMSISSPTRLRSITPADSGGPRSASSSWASLTRPSPSPPPAQNKSAPPDRLHSWRSPRTPPPASPAGGCRLPLSASTIARPTPSDRS